MKTFYDCYPCLINLAVNISRLTGMDERATGNFVDRTLRLLLEKGRSLNPPRLAERVYRMLGEHCRLEGEVIDPYHTLKVKSNRTALEMLPRLEEMLAEAPDRLETAVRIAAAGNIIDFGARDHRDLDIRKEVDDLKHLSFGIWDLEAFAACARKGGSLLYIGDNAGEIVFDKVFIGELLRQFPGLKITFAVRGRPILNDALMEDARMVGMEELVPVISSGSCYPGTILVEADAPFRQAFDEADLVIAKGQGNYETMGELTRDNLFFILRIKCGIIGEHIGAPKGSLVLYRNTGADGRDERTAAGQPACAVS